MEYPLYTSIVEEANSKGGAQCCKAMCKLYLAALTRLNGGTMELSLIRLHRTLREEVKKKDEE